MDSLRKSSERQVQRVMLWMPHSGLVSELFWSLGPLKETARIPRTDTVHNGSRRDGGLWSSLVHGQIASG